MYSFLSLNSFPLSPRPRVEQYIHLFAEQLVGRPRLRINESTIPSVELCTSASHDNNTHTLPTNKEALLFLRLLQVLM